jgi:hypothetical protein
MAKQNNKKKTDKKAKSYKAPAIVSYSENQLLDEIGPAQTCGTNTYGVCTESVGMVPPAPPK